MPTRGRRRAFERMFDSVSQIEYLSS
ncbi:hypothetical protein L3Y19_gp102 [Gordonia phage Neville]|uniref:Uncharacterized protein n=1 Tax=Gordonia phage Neville TaxID=2301693 RepID=A0A385E0V6_9CAUD|nr:hypothetical protein L3Y19_gp102 [Gordonia phage Neville]AXQ64502.1 hypothetical protein SEA_NEVILLE_128 [Gordonia phage Neville]